MTYDAKDVTASALAEIRSKVESWIVDETDWFWENEEYSDLQENLDEAEAFIEAVGKRALELVEELEEKYSNE